jgi:general secretion pathway protein J
MKDAGFTLLELLIAMTLLALLSLVLFGAFRFGTRSWDRAETSTANGNEIRRAQDAITSALSRAYPELQTADPANPHIFFGGEREAVTFLGPDRNQDGALDVITLGRQGDALTMIVTPELARDPKRQTVIRKLLGHVSFLELSYFGAGKPDDPPRWWTRWHNAARLPQLIRIRASLSSGRPGWTEMIVTPHIAADASCNYDALSKFCQGR